MAKQEDKYFENEDIDLINGTFARHPNRNEDKTRERTRSDGRRGSLARKEVAQSDNHPVRDNHIRQSPDSQRHFFVLILSKKQAKFFRGDLSGLQKIEISELPNGIGDVVHLEEKDQKLFRTSQSGRGNVHGVGAGVPDEKENISMYLKEVDQTLWKEGLNKENTPLVLGGVEYIVAIYKEISQYRYIMDKVLTGSLENEDPKEIYKRAAEIVSPVIV